MRGLGFGGTQFSGISMTLYKYFAIKDKLPSPNGPLSLSVPSSSIAAANAEVRKIVDDIQRKNPDSDLVGPQHVKRGSYPKYLIDAKLKIAMYAAENGIMAALRKYCHNYPELN